MVVLVTRKMIVGVSWIVLVEIVVAWGAATVRVELVMPIHEQAEA